MLVIYDNKGQIYFAGTGMTPPEGLPYLNVEVPEGKYIVGVDVSKEPHEAIFAEYPPSEIDILKGKVEENATKTDEISATVDSILTEVLPSLTGM